MTKRLKAELVAALSMLIIAALMLTTASFAWMTISQTAEVNNLAVSMGTTGNMEIAMAKRGILGEIDEVKASDAGIETTWGAKVTKFTSTEGINWPTIVSGGNYYTVAFSSDGRTNGVTQKLTESTGTMLNGVAKITANISDDGTASQDVTKTIGVGYGVWVRTNQNLDDVTFTLDTSSAIIKRNGSVASDLTGDDVTVAVTLYTFTALQLSNAAITEVDYGSTGVSHKTLTSGDEVALQANVPALAVINIGIKGDKLIAADFTSGSALTIEGISITFKSDDLVSQYPNS